MSPLGELASVLMALALGTQATIPQPEAPTAPPPDLAIDGVSLGQSFEELDDRFDLSDLNPMEREGKRRYVWRPEPDYLLSPWQQREGRVLQTLTLLFENGRLVKARATYASSLAFSRMGLVELYGEPTSIFAPPPRRTKIPEEPVGDYRSMQVRPARPESFALWIQIWTWEWEGVTFRVIGEHYAERDGKRITKGRHFFHFQLEATQPGC